MQPRALWGSIGCLLIIVGALLSTKPVFATSGACSYHGGVNCDIQGLYATCNDGTQSGVLYSDMDECQNSSSLDQCTIPVAYCTQSTLDSYKTLEAQSIQKCQTNNALLGITNGDCSQPSLDSQSRLCQTEINAYQIEEQGYQSCVQNMLQTLKDNASATYNLQKQTLEAEICAMKMGYAWNAQTNTCVGTDALCQSFGPNAVAFNTSDGKTLCQCAAGYQWNTNMTVCVSPTPTNPTTTPTISDNQPTIVISANLRLGSSGDDVTSLQEFLESKGFLTMPHGASKGYFGGRTKQALIAFQKSAGLPATGYCGSMTRSAINSSQ